MKCLIDKQIKKLTVFLICCFPLLAVAQVNYNVEPTNFSEKRYGPNNAHHMAMTIRFGTLAPDGETEADMLYRGGNIAIGVRYKRKITNAIHFNTELSYDFMDYRFNAIYYVPGTGHVEKATQQNTGFSTVKYTQFIHHNIELAPTVRIRFNRGQGIGWYTDLGAYGYWTAGGSYAMHGKQIRYGDVSLTSRLIPDNTFGYGVMGRLGYNFIALYYKYRMQQPMDQINLPPHTIGIELDINFNG